MAFFMLCVLSWHNVRTFRAASVIRIDFQFLLCVACVHSRSIVLAVLPDGKEASNAAPPGFSFASFTSTANHDGIVCGNPSSNLSP